MIRNYKAFGLAILAMAALGALTAQAASASPLTVPSAKTFFTGDQDEGIQEFESSSVVKCTSAVFSASATGPSVNELSITPVYNSCTAFGFATAHVKVNGCTYLFTTPTRIKADEVTWHPSAIHIVCPSEKQIEVTPTSFGVSVCTQKIGAQTPTSGHIVGTNKTEKSPKDVTLDITLEGIHYTGTGGACGTSGTTAKYRGSSTVRGYSDEAHTKQVAIEFS
jgi:hypothetical protein